MLKGIRSWLGMKTGVGKKVHPAGAPAFEPLEPRLLLSADLTEAVPLLSQQSPLGEHAIYVDPGQPDDGSQEGGSSAILTQLVDLDPVSLGAQERVIFSDNFDGAELDLTRWMLPVWQSPTDGTFLGRTQLRVAPGAAPPGTSGGLLHLQLDTYNPTAQTPGDSFYGQEIISRTTFSRGEGLAFETRARVVLPTPGGIVYAPFLYALIPGENAHDEIDFELLTNEVQSGTNRVQTNVYDHEPWGAGSPQFSSVPGGDLTQYHTYRTEWLPDQVRWYVDGMLIRTETVKVPDGSMPVYLNTWAPAADWVEAYSGALQPATSAADNQTFFFDVDYVTVSSLGDPVVFSDANLKAAIEEALGVSDPTASDMAGLETLAATGRGIVDLTGIENAVNLSSLWLDFNAIRDISPLSGLTSLSTLSLGNNEIRDISPLSGLTNLSDLRLGNNQVSSISPLLGLTRLSTLDLSSNQVSDISALSGVTSLSGLWIGGNQISDISPLSGLTRLSSLYIDTNEISDLSPLSGLTQLLFLDLHDNQISDLSPLSGLTSLSSLNLYTNQISNISPLSGLTSLSTLVLNNNQVSDLSPLSGLTKLSALWLYGNEISDISPLSGLAYLVYLDLGTNQISSVAGLSGLTALEYLNLQHNPLNGEAYAIYIPQILADNPGITLEHDPPPVLSDTDAVSVPEDSIATFQVKLLVEPASDVIVTVARVDGDSDISVTSGSSLTFTPSNWNTYQTVTLSAARDADTTNGTATIRCSASGLADKDVTATEQDNMLRPVYRFWKSADNTHFYTIKESEKQKLIDNYSHIYTYEGPAFYAYATGQHPIDTLPVYRFWKPQGNTHFFTIKESEKDKLINLFSLVFTFENTAWYAYAV